MSISCYEQYCVENPLLLLLVVPIFLVLVVIIYLDFIRFKTKEKKKEFHKKKRWLRFMMLISRTLMAFCLLVAFALPFTTQEVTVDGDPIIKVLVDSSESMNVFGDDLVSQLRKAFEGKAPIEISQISSGKRSELGDGIVKKIEGSDNLVLLTDGNNHYGKVLADVGIYSRISDTKLFAIELDTKEDDAWVRIIGPKETIESTSNKFKIMVDHVGNQPSFTLQVFVNDKLEFSGKNVFEHDLIKSFPKGSHRITAKIILEDHFEQNNVFYKSLKTVPKPYIAFVSTSPSSLEEGLRKIYKVDSLARLHTNLDKYDAIVFNDVPYATIRPSIDDLTGFLLDGKGIFFIGGKNSFNNGDYKDSLVEGMLPVKVGVGRIIDSLTHNIIIVLDVSDSFSDFAYKEGAQGSALDLAKGMAIKMIDNFRDNINVGVVAFANIGQIVAEPIVLKDNRQGLNDKIKRLRGGQGTSIDQGLIMAEIALEGVRGTKNVILISDGKMGHIIEPTAPKLVAQRMAQKGTKIYTVGLPSLVEDDNQHINAHFMRVLADIGGGSYFEPQDSQFLNVFFGKPEAKEKIFSGSSNLAVVDKEHFITKDLDIKARVSGINFVVPKLGAKNLIFTGDGNPILNTWNFGLGRVITLATDDGSNWAGALLSKDNSLLLTRAINYAVGNPERDREISIKVNDGFLGERNEVIVRSDKYPVSDDLSFVKEGENKYVGSFSPDEPGFYQFFDAQVAINNHKEYFGLGQSPKVSEMVSISGGKMLRLDKNIAEELQSLTKRSQTQRQDLSMYPLGVLLLIFLIEIFIRKLFEQRQLKVIS